MSLEAQVWVLGSKVGDPTQKLMLLGWANHAHRDGTNAWATPATIAEYAECSKRTVQRHLEPILSSGWMREGDQRAVQHLPRQYRPIVYDLAMSEEVRLRWAAEYSGDGLRASAAKRGAKGGAAAAANRRRPAPKKPRGDNLAPQQISRGDTLTPLVVDRGDNLAPLEAQVDRGDNLTPPSGVPDCHPGGDTAVSPEPPVVAVGGLAETVPPPPSPPAWPPAGNPAQEEGGESSKTDLAWHIVAEAPWPNGHEPSTVERGRVARAIVGVLEKGHTPTAVITEVAKSMTGADVPAAVVLARLKSLAAHEPRAAATVKSTPTVSIGPHAFVGAATGACAACGKSEPLGKHVRTAAPARRCEHDRIVQACPTCRGKKVATTSAGMAHAG